MGLVADVFKATMIQGSGNVLATSTLQDANIDVKVNETEIRGGQGDNILYTLHSGRDISIALNDPEFRYDFLAAQLGSDIVTGAGIAWASPKWYTVTGSTTLKISLDNAPVKDGDPNLAIYDASGARLAKTTDYTITGSDITIVKASIKAGDKVEVRTYKYDTDAKTETIEINARKFATGVQLILETVEIDDEENVVAILQYQFDKAIPDGNFQVNTKSDRSGSVNAMNLKVIKPKDSDVVGRVVRIPVTA